MEYLVSMYECPFRVREVPIMMGKHPYKVWVDLLRLLECPFKMCYALSGCGSAL